MSEFALDTDTQKRLKIFCEQYGLSVSDAVDELLANYQLAYQTQSEAFFHTLAENSTDIIAVYDRDLRHIYINPTVYRLADRPKSDFIGKTDRELGSHEEEDLIKWENALRRVLETGERQIIEMKAMHFSATLYFETAMSPKYNASGEIDAVITISRDVTVRRQYATELQKRERHYRHLFRDNEALQLLIDPETGQIVDANSATCDFYGYDHETITSMHIGQLNTLNPERVRAVLNEARDNSGQVYDFKHRLASGEIRDIRAYTSRVTMDERILMYAIIQDTTELAKLEVARKISEKRFRSLAEYSPDSVYVYALKDNKVEYCNKDNFLGYDIASQPYLAFQKAIIHPDDVDNVVHTWHTLVEDEGQVNDVTTLTYRIKDADGQWHWIQNRIVILDYATDGRPERIIITITDITGLKESELQALNSENYYRSVIAAMTEGLVVQRAYEEIITYNDAAQRMLGLSSDQVLAKAPTDPEWQVIHEDGTPFSLDEMPANVTLETGEPQSNVIMGIQKPDGQLTWVLVNTQPLYQALENKPRIVVSTLTDITQQKQSEDQLRILNRVVEQSPSSIVVTDTNGHITYVNQHFTELTGYTYDEAIGQNPNIQQSGHTDPEVYEDMWLTIQRGETWRGELLNKKKNGDLYWEEISIVAIKDRMGVITHYAAEKVNITARVMTQNALKDSEKRFRTLVGSIDDTIYTLDTEHRHTGVFGRWVDNFGVDEDFFLGKTAIDIMGPVNGQVHIDANNRVFEDKEDPVVYEWSVIEDEKPSYFQTSLSAFYDEYGKIEGLVGVGRNITSIREAEQAVRQSEKRYRSLFEQTNDGVFIIGIDNIILEINQRAADMLGAKITDVIGRDSTDFVISEEKPDAENRRELLVSGKKVNVYERTFRRLDGSSFIGEINAALVYDQEGKPLHIQSIVRDITDRKRAAEQELKLALQRERERIFSSFVESFSHEFRTPLSIINTRLYLLERTNSGRNNDVEARSKHIKVIQKQVTGITGLVDALVMMTRLEHNVGLANNLIDLNELLKHLAYHFERRAQEKQIAFQIATIDTLPMIYGDYEVLNEAIRHVVGNAIRYTPEKGEVSVSADHDDDMIHIYIKDTGEGIDADKIEHIFNAFYRADNARTTSGFGLGLTIARRIVQHHKGDIRVISNAEQGSTFILSLPYETEE